MIVIDYSNVSIAAISTMLDVVRSGQDDVSNLVRHVVLTNIKSYKKRFSAEYGSEIVIATDTAPYWRLNEFEYYKHNRKKERESSDIPWDLIKKHMAETLTDLKHYFPYKIISVQGAEADDIFAVVAQIIAPFNGKNSSLLDTDDAPEKTLMISSDKDISQLLVHPNIRQWSPNKKSYVKLEESTKMYLRRLILTGDSSDGIPNVFSPSDSFFIGKRQSPATEKKMLPLLEAKSMLDAAPTSEIRDRIIENTKLIAFNAIPSDIRRKIVEEYNKVPIGTKMSVLKYLASNDMKLMLDDVDEF